MSKKVEELLIPIKPMVILIFLGGLLVGFLIGNQASADPPSKVFYQWDVIGGGIAITDNVKLIPAMYRDFVVERRFSDIEQEAKVTKMVISSAEHRASLEESIKHGRRVAERNDSRPAPVNECTGFTVTQERRDHKERGHSLNSLFYIVKDLCGNEKSVTRTNPFTYFKTN